MYEPLILIESQLKSAYDLALVNPLFVSPSDARKLLEVLERVQNKVRKMNTPVAQ